jgi:hypothetical protein
MLVGMLIHTVQGTIDQLLPELMKSTPLIDKSYAPASGGQE